MSAFTDLQLAELKEELKNDPDGSWYGELPALIARNVYRLRF